jgi:hypothetical protein
MTNLLDTITTILMILGSLICIVFILYLRRKTYLRKKSINSLLVTIKYERRIVDMGEVVYRPNTPAQKVAKNRIHVKPNNYAYIFESKYSDLMNGCLK